MCLDAELGTGLVDLFLNGTDPFEAFAPTDDAFANLYEVLGAVLDDGIGDVTDLEAPGVLDVPLYHVAEGRRAANSVVPKKNDRVITSLVGETFSVRAEEHHPGRAHSRAMTPIHLARPAQSLGSYVPWRKWKSTFSRSPKRLRWKRGRST